MVIGDGKQVMTMTKATCPTQLKYTQQNFPMYHAVVLHDMFVDFEIAFIEMISL